MIQRKRIAIVGAGGCAREVAWLIADIARSHSLRRRFEIMEVAGFLVSDPTKASTRDSDILGDFSWLEKNRVDGLAMGIGSPEVRLRLCEELKRRFPRISWPTLIHPSVQYDESCEFREGVILCAGTIATVNVKIQEFAMVNRICTIGHLMGEVSLPPRGSDFALLDKKVVAALLKSTGSHPSVIGEIARLGFSQAEIAYIKEKRAAGSTKWTLKKKLTAFADAFVSFSYAPLRAMSYLGMLFSFLGFGYAILVVILRLMTRTPVQGWSSLIVAVLVLGGVQMMMLGVLGEYLWRTLEAARQRPIYFLEDSSNADTGATAQPQKLGRRFGT